MSLVLRALVALLGVALLVGALATVGACSEHFPTAGVAAAEAGASTSTALEASPPAIVDPVLRANASSSPVVFDPVRGGVWTANGDVGTLSYVDVDAREVVKEVNLATGADVRSVAVSPDGAFLAAVDRANGTVSVLDPDTFAVRLTLAVGGHPRACVWDSANPRWLYVAVEDTGSVVVVDRTEGTIADTIAVGRIPSGLAVSAKLRQLYVTHRIDAEFTVIDLGTRTVAEQIPLGDEPFTGPATPNGKPFGFEGLAVRADGARAWVPHELLAPTHPFVFSETLFPAVSVINLVDDVEQVTDPNSPNIAGRKNLFDAINLFGPNGQPEIFSQFCAVAMHPNGLLAWALACGSEDLVTFNVNDGMATDALRYLPGDHPVGLALDQYLGDAGISGQRIFVLFDQSHTLATLDTDGGSPVGHTTVYGDPIPLVAKDPVDPQLRAGLTLFFRANSTKGSLATTGNDWMSCGGCHLDGFGSTNLRLFESLQPSAPANDAEIGHIGLVDNFSTTPAYENPCSWAPGDAGAEAGQSSGAGEGGVCFEPHDVLVALLDQGGLAPDLTGANRAGEVDPSSPDPSAALMAEQLANVVANDLHEAPSWQLALGGPPATKTDTTYCGQALCHPTEYAEWSVSVHAHSAIDPMVHFCVGVETKLQGSQYPRLCAGCHDPVSARLGDTSMTSNRGITCLGCHDVDREIRAGGNGDLQATTHPDWTGDHKARAIASLQTLRQPEFCGGCHNQFVPGTGLLALSTLDEFEASPYKPTGEVCVDCHMPKNSSANHYDHRFPGGNVYLGDYIGDATLVAEQTQNLRSLAKLAPARVAGGVLVTITTVAGHSFPTGVTDIREPWVEVQAVDASGNVLAHFGGPDASGLVPPAAARLGTDIADVQGNLLLDHQLSAATRIPFDVRVPSGEAQALFVPVPDVLPAGTASLQAVLYYRNVRTTYYRDATGDPDGSAPMVTLAMSPVP